MARGQGPTPRHAPHRPPRHADRVRATLETEAVAARSFVAASWQRCMTLHRLDPEEARRPRRIPGLNFRETTERSEPLIRAAEPELDRLFGSVGRAGCCLVLTDAAGVTLTRRGVAAEDREFRSLGLWPGTDWSEASVGTNGIGTAIAEDRAVSIHRDQHFLTANTALSCATAPVRDHLGRLAGAVDISSCRYDMTPATLGILAQAVRDAAARIETRLFRSAFAGTRILLLDAEAEGRPALLAIDGDDLVRGATRAARRELGLDEALLTRGIAAADLLGAGESGGAGGDDLKGAESRVLRQALARSGGNVSAAAAQLGISRSTLHRKLRRLGLH